MGNINENLSTFHKTVKENPLFAAEGLNLENAKFTLGELKKSLEEIKQSWKSIMAKLFFLKYPPEETAHPIGFLESFIESESCRRKFLQTPSLEKAKELLEIWKKTLSKYKNGVENYRTALLAIQKLERIKSDTKLSYFDVAPTFNDFLDWTKKLLENSQMLEVEIRNYELILSKGRYSSIAKKTDSDYKKDFNATEKLDLRPVPKELKALIEIAEAKFDVKEKYESIVHILGNFDGGKITPRKFDVLFSRAPWKGGTSPKMITVILADDMYFLNLSKGHFLDFSIYKPLIERNLDYFYQPATTFYSNLDISYLAEIVTAVDFKRREFGSRNLVLKQKSSLLDLLIGTGVYHDIYFACLLKIFAYYKKLPKLSFFYLARAYPTLYFLSFNRSVWRLNDDALIQGTRFGVSSHYEKFSEISSKINHEKLKRIVDISANRMKYFAKELKNSKFIF